MAEPVRCGSVSLCVNREFVVSRLETQLLAKVYDLLIPAAQGRCSLPLSSAERARNHRSRGITSHTKGV
jgi:hypothetical protein